MKIKCPCCNELIEIDDADVKSYVGTLAARVMTDARVKANQANAKKPRPGAQGKPKPRKQKPEA